ncbi:MAG TPA: biotin/lipoyl-binding protein [Planctomicrobium sp.]|nr:biotin/lipoyl-binding protein [Planctomicrobium sp.]
MSTGDKIATPSSSLPAAGWNELEDFVAAIEQLSYASIDRDTYFTRLAKGVEGGLPSSQVQLTLITPEETTILAGKIPSVVSGLPAVDVSRFQPGESRYDTIHSDNGAIRIVLDHCFRTATLLRMEVQIQNPRGLNSRILQDVLGTCVVLSGQFLVRCTERDLQEQLADRKRIDSLIAQLASAETTSHRYCDLCRVLQTALEVDRVSLLQLHHSNARLLGTSVSLTVVRNSKAVKLQEKVTAVACRHKEPTRLIVGNPPSPVFSDDQSLIDSYVEETSVRLLQWIPVDRGLKEKKGPERSSRLGVLLLEQFSADWPDGRQQKFLDLATSHMITSARRLFVASEGTLSARLRTWLGDRGGWLTGLAAALLLAVVLLFTVQKDLEIVVDGVVMPVQRASIFSPMQGIVEQVPVRHGDRVNAGETLLVLRAPELAVEERRISGEISTLHSRLDALKAARIRNRVDRSKQDSDASLSAEESDLQAQLNGLTGQLDLIREQTKLLVITSPLKGQVDRWDLNQALADRPVAHGQHLCDVLDVEGDWAIDLRIPDNVVGYVWQAQSQSACPVTYLFRTNSDRKYESALERISNSAQVERDGTTVVPARMPVSPQEDQQLRVGASVMARINCGPRSIGFVWLREVIEFLQRTFWM